jgi:hypothetical protein
MMKVGQHDIIVGGASAHVSVYPANLLVEIIQSFNVAEDAGFHFFW